MRSRFFSILFTLVALLALPLTGRAQIVKCANLETGCTLDDFEKMITSTYELFFDYVGILAVFFFIIGGILLITSGGSPERVRRGRQILGGVITGMAVALLSYLIIDFIVKTLEG